jgi:tripartite-type tricarboxylate transporter receptor subunit TctC
VFVGPHVKARTFKEFVELARANPGKLTFGSAGVGSQVHVAGELVHKRLGVQLLHVRYRGAADLMPDIMSGRLDVTYDPALVRIAKEGKVRVLAYLGRQRSPDFPDVPTFAELGQQDVPLAWFGLFAPQGTPKAVADKAAQLCEKATADKAVGDRMRALTFWPAYLGPKAFGDVTQRDHKIFGDIIRELRIQGD